MPSTREIYSIFARNLRALVEGRGSVSDQCRALGVNRTQFNRYLSGQASPRPEVLHRICAYFGTDARILLQPLEELIPGAQDGGHPLALTALARFLDHGLEVLEVRQPPTPGIHRYWQRSSVTKSWANSYTVRVFQQDGATLFRAIEDRGRDGEPDQPGRKHRDVRGWFMDQDDGLVMQAFQSHGRRISFGFLNFPPMSDNLIYPGVVMVSRPATRQVTRLENCALELLPQGEELRPSLRARGGCKVNRLPDTLASMLSGKIG